MAIQYVFTVGDVEALFQSPDLVNHPMTVTNAGVLQLDGVSIAGALDINTLGGSPLTIANGGTGQITANAAFAALSPMTTNGDLITRSGGVPTRIAVGTNGQVLTVVAGIPAWTSSVTTDEQVKVSAADTTAGFLSTKLVAQSTKISFTINNPAANETYGADVVEANLTLNNIGGTLSAIKGGTGQTVYAVGDILYADTTTTLAKLPDVVTGNALISGGVGTAPSWGKIGLTTHVSGVLPIANGGTNGATALAGFNNLSPLTTQGDTLYRNATDNVRLPIGTALQEYRTNAGATAPEWFTPAQAHYAFAYDVATQTVATANTFQDVTFGTNAQLAGWTHTAATAVFTCAKTGLYQVTVYGNIERTATGATTAEFVGLFNGAQVAGSQALYEIGSNNQNTPVEHTFLVNATSGQDLKIQFTGGSTSTRLVGGLGNATVKPSVTVVVVPLAYN